MPNINQPLKPTRPPAIVKFHLGAYTSNGGSPQAAGIQLPSQGAYDLTFMGWGNNQDAIIHAHAKIVWYKFSGTSRVLAKTDRLAAPATSYKFGDANPFTDLTISDPSATGLVTVTLAWNDGATRTASVVAHGFQWSASTDFAF